jgi:hypothetical protein
MAKIVATDTWTNQELLDLYREALVELSVAQSTTLRGKTVTRASIPDILKMISWLEKRVAVDTGSGNQIVLARHGTD